MFYSLLCAKEIASKVKVKNIIKMIDSPALVMYGDSFLRVDFLEVCHSYKTNLGPLLVIYKNDGRYDQSNVYFDDDNILIGDLNVDNMLNILVLVILVNLILTSEYASMGDLNDDEIINILDAVILANIILEGEN